MTEKRVLLAAILSALFLTWYSGVILKPRSSPRSLSRPPSPSNQQAPVPQQNSMNGGTAPPHLIEGEDVITIESKDLRLEIGASSAAIRRVALHRFTQHTGTKEVTSDGAQALLVPEANASGLDWKQASRNGESVSLEAAFASKSYHITYALDSHNPILNVELSVKSLDESKIEPLDTGIIQAWSRFGEANHRQNPLEVVALFEKPRGGEGYRRYAAPWRGEHVLRGTKTISLSERYFCQTASSSGETMVSSLSSSQDGGVVVVTRQEAEQGQQAQSERRIAVYFGARDYFHLQRAGLAKAFPIGFLGQIGLILLSMLSWIARLTHSYGVAIILLAAGVTAAMGPFTLMGLRSMRKMQQLKPTVDRIMQAHKGNQAKANEELAALYKQHRVSPLGGCLPMLLQIPVFIALFQAISHFIELRGQRFLWIADLSLPDRVAKLPTTVPVLGEWINVLPVLTAVAMYLQTKLSQPVAATENNPTAKMMSGPLVPLVFCFMFYHLPSGLILYWLTNSLTSIAIYRAAGGTATSAGTA